MFGFDSAIKNLWLDISLYFLSWLSLRIHLQHAPHIFSFMQISSPELYYNGNTQTSPDAQTTVKYVILSAGTITYKLSVTDSTLHDKNN